MALNKLKSIFIIPLIKQLQQGVTPHKLSLGIASGFVIGFIPVLGATTALSLLVAFVFRLNHVATQVATHASYPLQFLLLIPFFRLGEKIFHVKSLPLSIPLMFTSFKNDFWGALQLYGATGARGVVAWILTAPFAFLIVYGICLYLLKLYWARKHSNQFPNK